MKRIYTLTTIAFFILSLNNVNAQTVWTGPTTTFTKFNNANWNLEANQDRITNNVWITRGDTSTLFNIKVETDAGVAGESANPAPSDTEWAYGTTANYNTLAYQSLNALIGQNYKNIVDGQDMVIHLITDDIYIDLKFTSWTKGNGGGFTYERSTDQSLSSNEFKLDKNITLFPNPSSDFIQVSNLIEIENFKIFNILGVLIKKGTISNSSEIDIKNFDNGLYFLKFDKGNTLTFLKK